MIGHCLAAFGIILGVNLMPAFGPPTWSLLVFFRLNWHLNPVALVLIGVTAATMGRVVLALAARRLRDHFPPKALARLGTAQEALESHRFGTMAVFVLFVISPLPSAQLFLAAGLLELPLVPITIGFVIGRMFSYSLYVTLATLAEKSLGSALGNMIGSPWAILVEVVLLAALAALPLVDWSRFIRHKSGPDAVESDPGAD